MSQLLGSGYHIGGPTGRCAATGRALSVGEPFVATLSESAHSDDLLRADYCASAWDSGARPAGMVGSWRGVVPAPDAKRNVIIDDDTVLDLFEQLAEQTEPRRVAFRFVLALMLIRRRKLACDETRRAGDGQPGVLLVRRRGDPKPPEGPAYTEVIDPGLDEEAIDGIMEQFESVLSGVGLDAPPPAVEPKAEAPPAEPMPASSKKRRKRTTPGEAT